jgi:hypothetical protein
MAIQLKLYDDKIDSPTAIAADRLIETQEALTTAKETYEEAGEYLMTLLKKAAKKRIRHNGKLIEIVITEEKEKIKVKEEKSGTGKRETVDGKKDEKLVENIITDGHLKGKRLIKKNLRLPTGK